MSNSTPLSENSNHSVEQFKNEILTHWHNFHQLARRTVEEAWHTGRCLNELKAGINHGDWLPWLKQAGIPERTAQRLMLIAEKYQIRQAVVFESVDEALKALPKPPDPDPDPGVVIDVTPVEEMPPATKLTPAEKRLIEEDQLKSTVALAGEQITELETRIAEKDKVIQHYETAGKVSEGFIQGRDVIEAGHEEIRQLKYSLNNCLEENATVSSGNYSG